MKGKFVIEIRLSVHENIQTKVNGKWVKRRIWNNTSGQQAQGGQCAQQVTN